MLPPVPPSLSLPILNGTDWVLPRGAPIIFNAYDATSGFSMALWQNPSSVDELLKRASPKATSDGAVPASHFVFLSHSEDAERDVAALAVLIGARLDALGISEGAKARWQQQLHFVSSPVHTLPFITDVLDAWPTATNAAVLHRSNGTSTYEEAVPRLDARYDWLGWNYNPSQAPHLGRTPTPLVFVGSACGDLDPALAANVSGKIALADNTTQCDYFEQVRWAQRANASALVVVAADGQPLLDMNCVGEAECSNSSVALPATMISHAAGETAVSALARGEHVAISFVTTETHGTDFAIDADGALQQSWGGSGLGAQDGNPDGNPGDLSAKLYPSMSFLAWAGRFLMFERGLSGKIAADAHTTTSLALFDRQPIRPPFGDCYGGAPWACGPSVVVKVPPLVSSTRWELLLALGCNGTADVACPQWDHVVQLRACVVSGAWCNAQEGAEVARWVTSFSRRVGQWLVDITTIAPLIASPGAAQAVNFTIYSAPWAGDQGRTPWLATLTLRVTADDAAAAAGGLVLQPWKGVTTETGGIGRVFQWVAFNQTYNDRFAPFAFALPRGSKQRVRLHALITGHGNDNHGCGEFCATQHHFTLSSSGNVSGTITKRDMLPVTGEQLGCAEEVDSGVTPNEYGTWLYGRDGWCNGRPVLAFEADVTDLIYRVGGEPYNVTSATLEYRAEWCSALGQCAPPEPGPPSTWEQAPPVMMVSVYLVLGDAPVAPLGWWRQHLAAVLSVGGATLATVALASALFVRRRGCARRAFGSGGSAAALLSDPQPEEAQQATAWASGS